MSSREIAIVLAVLVGVILVVPVLSMSIWGFGMMGSGPMGPGMMGRGMMGGGYWPLIAFLLLAGVVLLIVALTRRTGSDPLELLKQRLAKGEVTREQFEELKQILQS